MAGLLHRMGAIVTFGYFALQLVDLFQRKAASGKSWLKFITDNTGMMFSPVDGKEFIGSIKWFLGRARARSTTVGPTGRSSTTSPSSGASPIGASGLMLWFPTFFTKFVPGWALNVATIIHSDEALLAVGSSSRCTSSTRTSVPRSSPWTR